MSKAPILIMSDMHYHGWSQFATLNDEGVNSRLQETLDATNEAIDHLLEEDGHTVVLCGDTFHTRGNLTPDVLNPVLDLFDRRISKDGVRILAVPGNHDLSGDSSRRIGNSVAALEKVGVTVAHRSLVVGDLCLFPWYPTVNELMVEMEKTATKTHKKRAGAKLIGIIHAPIDGVLPHLPSKGLNGAMLGKLGYNQIFAGHYHNHVEIAEGVFSVGALTHQSFRDIGSKAGYIIVSPDGVKHRATRAPKFVELTGSENEEEMRRRVAMNFVRVKCVISDASEMNTMRKEIKAYGAAGVVIHPVKIATVKRAKTKSAGESSLEGQVAAYVKSQKLSKGVESISLDILAEARGL